MLPPVHTNNITNSNTVANNFFFTYPTTMQIQETKLKGCVIITPTVHKDNRGYFFESFQLERLKNNIADFPDFVQDNEAYSAQKGVIRGLHGQMGAAAQAKLVRVIKGAVIDVAVDMRTDSATFGEHVAVLLDENNKKQLLVPRGFLHGYIVLQNDTIFAYKCDGYYNKSAEFGIHVLDKDLNIDWQLSAEEFILSEKDAILPTFKVVAEQLKSTN